MNYPILFCDRQFFDMARLLEQKGKNVVVHSIFEKAVNLEAEGHLYTILAAGTRPLFPEETAYLGVPKTAYVKIQNFRAIRSVTGAEVPGGKHGIQIGKACFPFSEQLVLFPDAFFKPDDLPEAGEDKISRGLERFDGLLPELARKKGAGAGPFYMNYFGREKIEPELLQKELEKRLSIVCNLLREEGKEEELQRAVAKTVGAGIGLTPSADDFFCGMFIAMCCMEGYIKEKVKKAVVAGIGEAADRKRTTEVSREMLLFHVQKSFPRLYKKLAEAFLTGGTGMEPVMEKLAEVGHSSGVDMACGMAAAFRIFIL